MSLTTVTFVAGTPPNVTEQGAAKPAPVMVTGVPPAGPTDGDMLATPIDAFTTAISTSATRRSWGLEAGHGDAGAFVVDASRRSSRCRRPRVRA